MSRRAALAALAAALGLTALAGPADAAQRRPRLVAFGSCRALVDYAHTYAARVGGVGVPVRALTTFAPLPGAPSPAAAETTAPAAAPGATGKDDASAGTPSFSTTNVQETGIDEPDVVKTDGNRIVTITDGLLRVVDVTGDAPRIAGTLKLDPGVNEQLLLRGDRALVLATTPVAYPVDVVPPVAATPVAQPAIVPIGGGSGPTTTLTEVDLTDPTAPKVARTMTVDGGYVDARQTDGTVRVVVSSTPAPVGARPLAQAPLRTFVPATTIRSRISGRTFRRGVVGCGAVRRPDVFSGLDLLTVLTIDLDKGLYDVDRDAIMAGAQTVYGSATSLYVASRRYVPGLQDTADVPAQMRTEIHRFDASHPGETTYAATGEVPGFILNNYALSEQDGVLRVASTDEPSWLPDGGAPAPASSSVTVLRQDGGRLVRIGRVGGLGRGQKIYAVRFAGSVGYVVTFRQIDPLYTLDLSDPAAPRVAGELELPGYSAYLHPLGDGLLLGVGQEVDAQGRPQGTQVSLFDVADPAHPRRLQHAVYGRGSSDAEFDPHAFLWWAPTDLAVLPLAVAPSSERADDGFIGAVGLRVTRQGIAEAGRVTHGSGDHVAPVGRSLVIGNRLYTLSWLGLQASRLDTLAPVATVPFVTG